MATRVSKTWEYTNTLTLFRDADDMHRKANRQGCGFSGHAATGAIVALLDKFATPCDCAALALYFGCHADAKSLAYAIRDCADERHENPSTVIVDLLKLQVIG